MRSGRTRHTTRRAPPEKPHGTQHSLCPSVRATCVRRRRGPPSGSAGESVSCSARAEGDLVAEVAPVGRPSVAAGLRLEVGVHHVAGGGVAEPAVVAEAFARRRGVQSLGLGPDTVLQIAKICPKPWLGPCKLTTTRPARPPRAGAESRSFEWCAPTTSCRDPTPASTTPLPAHGPCTARIRTSATAMRTRCGEGDLVGG